MKTTALILFLIPSFCFAQQESNATLKPATDACPSWNKKSKSSSKAEYFYFLRTGKAKGNQAVQNYYPNNTSQRAYPSKAIVRYAPEEDPFLIPKRLRNNTQNIPKKASASGFGDSANLATADPENTASKSEEIKTLPKQEPVLTSVQKEEPKIAEVLPIGESKNEGKSVLKKDKPKKDRGSKRRANRSSGQKVKECKSGDASKCPSF